MSNSSNSTSRNSLYWNQRLLERDLADLQREEMHLRTKRRERELTAFEFERLLKIAVEREALMAKLSSLTPAQIAV